MYSGYCLRISIVVLDSEEREKKLGSTRPCSKTIRLPDTSGL